MKELAGRLVAAVCDLRIVVAIVGVTLSVVLHELFHVIVHWGDIKSVHIFPDAEAIAAVLIALSGEYDLMFEEALAYLVTMVTLLLTAKLVADIHDARDTRGVREVILGKSATEQSTGALEGGDMAYIASLLGIESARS